MNPTFLDCHCHLDLYPDFPANVERLRQSNVTTIAVTTTPRAFRRNAELARGNTAIRPALGLHPQLVNQKTNELRLWMDLAPEAMFIGEVGLDAGPRFFRSLSLQEEVFDSILRTCSRLGGKVISIHSTRAVTKTLDAIERHAVISNNSVILHWFSGTVSELKRAVVLGCYFSVNPAMLATTNGRRIILNVPQVRLLTESDGPFVHSISGSQIGPEYVPIFVDDLAELLGVCSPRLSAAIFTNWSTITGNI